MSAAHQHAIPRAAEGHATTAHLYSRCVHCRSHFGNISVSIKRAVMFTSHARNVRRHLCLIKAHTCAIVKREKSQVGVRAFHGPARRTCAPLRPSRSGAGAARRVRMYAPVRVVLRRPVAQDHAQSDNSQHRHAHWCSRLCAAGPCNRLL